MDFTRFRRHGLSLGILVFGLLTALLVVAFVSRIGAQRPDATRIYNPNGLLGDIIQVEVLNGCGVSGLAGRMTDHLRFYGFDVVEHGDFDSFDVEQTRIIDRIGNLDAAKQVALALGVPEERIEQDVRSDYYLDVSVIIGVDYKSVMPFSNETEDS